MSTRKKYKTNEQYVQSIYKRFNINRYKDFKDFESKTKRYFLKEEEFNKAWEAYKVRDIKIRKGIYERERMKVYKDNYLEMLRKTDAPEQMIKDFEKITLKYFEQKYYDKYKSSKGYVRDVLPKLSLMYFMGRGLIRGTEEYDDIEYFVYGKYVNTTIKQNKVKTYRDIKKYNDYRIAKGEVNVFDKDLINKFRVVSGKKTMLNKVNRQLKVLNNNNVPNFNPLDTIAMYYVLSNKELSTAFLSRQNRDKLIARYEYFKNKLK